MSTPPAHETAAAMASSEFTPELGVLRDQLPPIDAPNGQLAGLPLHPAPTPLCIVLTAYRAPQLV